MILGMSLAAFTLLHVAISLIAIASGIVVILGMIGAYRLHAVTALFLTTTVLTSVTGFLFPYKGVTPGIVIGILSLIVLAAAIFALYGRGLAGAWRGAYVITASIALYFNFFVLVVQSFEKTPALKAIAPTQASPVFGITQLAFLAIFVVLTILAYKKFPGTSSSTASSAGFQVGGAAGTH
ncbi:MAG TPA: hypothetical protein VK720_01040 [Terracidiphilus sp.]|jgi:hypothetical protein|nr:hypothetical protein [Terracidiphilus sp.]